MRQDVFTPCAKAEDGSWIAYEAILNIRAWKTKAKVVIVHDLDPDTGRIKAHRIYAATDLSLSGGDILHMYQCRYQQEFLFRDAKQEAGLEDCQAYSWEKIYFHVNTALTAVSLAKAADHLEQPSEQRGPSPWPTLNPSISTPGTPNSFFPLVGWAYKNQKLKPSGTRSLASASGPLKA